MYNSVTKINHQGLSRTLRSIETPYDHYTQENLIENGNAKIYWYEQIMDRPKDHKCPDILVKHSNTKLARIIDLVIYNDSNLLISRAKKINKYDRV